MMMFTDCVAVGVFPEPGVAYRACVWIRHALPSCLRAFLHSRPVEVSGRNQKARQLLNRLY